MEKNKNISIWGFRRPLQNDYGDWFGFKWVMFKNPLIVDKKEFEEAIEEKMRVRFFEKDMRQEADDRWNNSGRGDVWSQFWAVEIPTPQNIQELLEMYKNFLRF